MLYQDFIIMYQENKSELRKPGIFLIATHELAAN